MLVPFLFAQMDPASLAIKKQQHQQPQQQQNTKPYILGQEKEKR